MPTRIEDSLRCNAARACAGRRDIHNTQGGDHVSTNIHRGRHAPRTLKRRIAAAVATGFATALSSGGALAFEIDTGNPDLTIRWDNTVRFNYAVRVEGRDSKIGNSPIADEGTWSFDRGDAVATRLDLLTEVDLIWKKDFGARLSAAGWYDAAYDDTSRNNPNLPFRNIPSYINNRYTSTITRFYQGPSGELLDAFVFGRFDVGSAPASKPRNCSGRSISSRPRRRSPTRCRCRRSTCSSGSRTAIPRVAPTSARSTSPSMAPTVGIWHEPIVRPFTPN
jgi:hypothetical protein